jgi:hypothetical protein
MRRIPEATAQLIEEAWDILYNCTNPIRDYLLYLEGIIKKLMEESCPHSTSQDQKKSSKEKFEESKETTTEPSMKAPHWLKPAFDLETLKRLNAI